MPKQFRYRSPYRHKRECDSYPDRPWTPEEEEKLIEITRIGLTSFAWDGLFDQRSFYDITLRRMELRDEGRVTLPRDI